MNAHIESTVRFVYRVLNEATEPTAFASGVLGSEYAFQDELELGRAEEKYE
jgi:hypothetical protein